VCRRHRVASGGDFLDHFGAAHQLVVLRVDELWREELFEQRAVSLDEPCCPRILKTRELDSAGFDLLVLLLGVQRDSGKREQKHGARRETKHG
jgi:hypothetical protein